MTESKTQNKPDCLIDMKQVISKVSMSKTAVYALLKDGKFPAKIKFGRLTRFSEQEIDEWIAQAKAGRA